MDHLVLLETSLLILPACACGTHADRCIHENTGFIAPHWRKTSEKKRVTWPIFAILEKRGRPVHFYNSLPFSGLETSRDERGHVAPLSP